MRDSTCIDSSELRFGLSQTECMKGVAILSIMLCHFMGVFGNGIRLFTPLGGIGVSIFLLLSGYGLNESHMESGLKKWWLKRIIGVFFPYAVIQSILFWTRNPFSFTDYIKDITFIAPRYGNGWYLNFLLLNYMLFYCTMLIPFTRKYKIAIFMMLGIGIFIWGGDLRAEQAFLFPLGLCLSEYKKRDAVKRLVNLNWATLLIIFGIFFLLLKQLDCVRNLPDFAV